VTAVTPSADLAIGKSGAATVFATSNLTYTISVTNLGPSAAGVVVVTDSLPAGAAFVLTSGGGVNNGGTVNWSLGPLTAGQVSNVTVTVTAPAGGALTNVATVSSPAPDTNFLNNTSPPVTTAVTPVADVVLGNAGPANVLAGAAYTNTISVTNLGPSVAGNIVVVDTEPDGTKVTNTVPGLASGGVTNFLVVEVAPGAGPLTNSASSSAATGDPVPLNNTNIVAVTAVTPSADLAIGKSGAATVFATSNLTYTISVTNLGPSAAGVGVVTDSLPAGAAFVLTSGGGVNNGGTVNWSLGPLTAGQVSNVPLTVTAPAGGALTNVATVSSPAPDTNFLNNTSPPVTTAVTPVADVVLGNAGPANVLAGAAYTNTISVTNLGPSVAGNIVVVDTEPDGTKVTNTVPGLASGGVTNFLVVEVAPGAGPLTNSASSSAATGDPVPLNNTNIVAVTAVTPSADLAIGKSGAATVFATSNLTYTISVTNLGPSAAGVV